MEEHYLHLGIFSDWVSLARQQGPLYPLAPPGPATQDLLRQQLGFTRLPEAPLSVRVEETWEQDSVAGEVVSWWVGFGPRTRAFVLKPAGVDRPLPGVVALHDHSGFKFYGKEKIAVGPLDLTGTLMSHFAAYYSGRAYANALAREGFVVLIHDTFLWGSRRFPIEDMPQGIQKLADLELGSGDQFTPAQREVARYNLASSHHEHVVEKYCNLLGTTMAGVVSYEDRIAVNYLLSRADVLPERLGCIGLSGGGNRSALLFATHARIQAAVIVGLMSTYPGLLDHNVYTHTWMLFPNGWSRHGDWPDIAACRAPLPLLVLYDLEDDLFTLEGMQAGHQRLAEHYHKAGAPQNYTGLFYPGPHKFDLEMQAAAFSWLKDNL